MPRKTSKKSTAKKTPKPFIETTQIEPVQTYQAPIQEPQRKSNTKAGLIILLIILAGVLLFRKGYLVAAIVNGRPIYTWTLNQALVARFGKQQIESMITESLIYQEGQKSGVSVSAADIENREAEMIKGLGADVKLEEVLKFQGMTKADFDTQVKLQLTVEKILSSELKFTDAQLDNYISTNSAKLTATSSAAKKEEAKKMLMEEGLSTKVPEWLQKLKDNAKIMRLL